MKRRTPAKKVKNRLPDGLKTKFTDNPVARMQRATAHPCVKEFNQIVCDAAKLQVKLRRWLRQHDRPEDTQGVLALALAFSRTDDDLNPDGLAESFSALRSIDWVIMRSVETVKAYVIGEVFEDISRSRIEH